MKDKIVDGSAADAMIEASAHLAKIEMHFRELKWRFCYKDMPLNTHDIKTHCRKLLEAINSFEYRVEQAKVIQLDERVRG